MSRSPLPAWARHLLMAGWTGDLGISSGRLSSGAGACRAPAHLLPITLRLHLGLINRRVDHPTLGARFFV
jgi:hypothetical protein